MPLRTYLLATSGLGEHRVLLELGPGQNLLHHAAVDHSLDKLHGKKKQFEKVALYLKKTNQYDVR